MGPDSCSDEDYMSDKFLNPATKKPVTREHIKSSRCIPRGKQMDVKREEGLKRRIGEDNIGYKLMIKMGFKGDGGIGKKSEGRSEPLPIEIIDGRKGLGLHNAEKRRNDAIALARQRRDIQMSAFQSDFRASMASRFHLEKAQRQLKSARSICQRLDLARSIEQPVDKAFWPPDETRAKLLSQSEVIRREICRSDRPFGNRKKRKLQINGFDRDDILEDTGEHQGEYDTVLGIESDDEVEYCDIDAAQYGPVESQPDVILSRLSAYLRESHFYCFWCGAQYSSDSDLRANCPGPMEEDHV